MSQVVGSVLLDHPAYLDECMLQIKDSRDYLFGMLQAMAGEQPKIASICNTRSNFVYMKVENAAAAHKALLEQGCGAADGNYCVSALAMNEKTMRCWRLYGII